MKIKSILFLVVLAGLSACGQEKTNKKAISSKPIVQQEQQSEKTAIESEKAVISEEQSSEAAVITEEPTASVPKEQLEKAKAILASVDVDAIKAIDAKRKYKMVCATCHGFKGNMNVNGAKDLTKSKISLEESVAQIYFGKGLMAPSKGILDDAEIVAVAQYIQEFRK